jgi:hypothetical protein
VADVLISYSRHDRNIAKDLAEKVSALGYSVWWDADLVGGSQFRKSIEEEISNARAVLVIWSENSVHSEYVEAEANAARESRKLIPVRVASLDANKIPFIFRHIHCLPIDDIERIAKAISIRLEADTVDGRARSMAERLRAGRLEPNDFAKMERVLARVSKANTKFKVTIGQIYPVVGRLDATNNDARTRYEEAERRADASAMLHRAFTYEHGIGVARNDAEAVRLYQLAIAKDDGCPLIDFGMQWLAAMFADGRGVAQNDIEASRLCWRAAEKGNRSAMIDLALMYDTGRGVRRDPTAAARWFFAALQKGIGETEMATRSQEWSAEFRSALQQELKSAFHYDGAIDGEFGPKTLAAINSVVGSARQRTKSPQ